MSIDITLPDIGDGIDSGDVLEVLVNEGDQIEKDQGVVEVETDKAAVEIPSPHTGTVDTWHVEEAQVVFVGAVMVTFGGEGASTPAPAKVAASAASVPATAAPARSAPAPASTAHSTVPAVDNPQIFTPTVMSLQL